MPSLLGLLAADSSERLTKTTLALLANSIRGSRLEACRRAPLLARRREPVQVRQYTSGWLEEQQLRLREASDDEDEEDGAGGLGYCGKQGCRKYPHEHVAWGSRES